jgi:crotonobetainyl-CoA:carnitine CoA-transferase CaiB-like acyl-CoA transferase
MVAVGREDMSTDIKYTSNADRVIHEADIDLVLANWCAAHSLADAMAILDEHRVPSGPVYNVADMMEDAHFKYRELFEAVEINGESLKIPALLPKLDGTPGGTEWPGPAVGSHTDEVLQSLGLDADHIAELKSSGVVADA